MGLEKAIFHGKEKRKPYRKAKSHSRGCRNHGSCKVCMQNRLHHNVRREPMDD